MINGQMIIQNEMGALNCSLILGEIKEMVRILRSYGVGDADIVSVMRKDVVLPNLNITDDCRIFIGEKRKEVCMEPLVKAVYLLFLKHPEGIIFKELPDYRNELADIYNIVRPCGLTERSIRSIEDVTNPLQNSINEKCARIRKVFTSMLDSSIAEQYYIKGKRGEPKKISLPRELVVWE